MITLTLTNGVHNNPGRAHNLLRQTRALTQELTRIAAMNPTLLLSRLNIDPYIVAIVGMVGLASVVPLHGVGTIAGGYATNVAIAALFFLHGAKLEPRAALAGARHWRLHVLVLLATFVL